ncbi:ATP synthase regulation protein NCA2 [Paramicrosporidium saccamoebae]|uniref:ATP synthase regulation protein NCA2 n=1 Tax=Paramicrosporidium saccamoebae TaxID=1246581 RepID=A0A2H9TND2_9FUNG|nr:ATP synthase regulation protein NCA2 [Paramicrosporidium saccamoebae]
MVDAVSLWIRAIEQQNINKESRAVPVVDVVRKKLDNVYKVEESIRYLKLVRRGGFLKHLLFQVETTNFRQLYNAGVGVILKRIKLTSFVKSDDLHERISQMEEARDRAIEDLGRTLLFQNANDSTFQIDQIPLIRPSWVSLYLVPCAACGIVGLITLKLISQLDWEEVLNFWKEAYHASQHLLTDWIANPIKDIWRTIRYRSSNLALASASALKADMESLERMVVSFAQKQYPDISADLVTSQVRQGDVTLLLKKYEEELQSPLRNVFAGNLVTMLLIQVQKSKVDLESAMLAMDRLLKANELNFELLAVVPLLFILYSTLGAGRFYVKRWLHSADKFYLEGIREKLHTLQALFNSNMAEYRISGKCLLIIQSLLDDLAHLSSNSLDQKHTELLLDDLQELFTGIPSERKLWTLSRILHFYPFLQHG